MTDIDSTKLYAQSQKSTKLSHLNTQICLEKKKKNQTKALKHLLVQRQTAMC